MTKCTRCGENNPAEIHTCTPQSKAQRLADWLVKLNVWSPVKTLNTIEAAAELRRLDALNAELVEALEDFSSYVRDEQCATDGPVTYSNTVIHRLVFKARAALAKAKEQT